jgi:hypothetical protein
MADLAVQRAASDLGDRAIVSPIEYALLTLTIPSSSAAFVALGADSISANASEAAEQSLTMRASMDSSSRFSPLWRT